MPKVPTMGKKIETGTVSFITVQGDELEFADRAIMYLTITVSNEEDCLSVFEDVHMSNRTSLVTSKALTLDDFQHNKDHTW